MVCRAKKKVISEGDVDDGQVETVDPLEDLEIYSQSYDIAHQAFIYFNQSGERQWTKGYFNNNDKGEKSVEISREMAIKFIHGKISEDAWLSRFYPKQMAAYKKAIASAKQMFLKY